MAWRVVEQTRPPDPGSAGRHNTSFLYPPPQHHPPPAPPRLLDVIRHGRALSGARLNTQATAPVSYRSFDLAASSRGTGYLSYSAWMGGLLCGDRRLGVTAANGSDSSLLASYLHCPLVITRFLFLVGAGYLGSLPASSGPFLPDTPQPQPSRPPASHASRLAYSEGPLISIGQGQGALPHWEARQRASKMSRPC